MECDGKRAGDTCTVDGGFGTCVTDCDARCLVCVAPKPVEPDKPLAAGGGGCSAAGATFLLLLLLARWLHAS